MNLRPFALFLACGALCSAQSVPTPSATPEATSLCESPSGEVPCTGTTPTSAAPQTTAPNLSAPQAGTQTTTAPSETPSVRPEQPASPSMVAAPPLAPSEFEIFAEDAAGSPLPVYGRQLFSQVPTTFAAIDHVPVPANYVIGPEDELLIRAWGKIDLDTNVTVDRNGQIFVPKVGALRVAGLHYEQVEGYIRSAIANLYRDFELNVTMGQLRSIQIFVLGSARQPGAYTVSSLSTLVNALFASGGPSATGSMRRIELRRGGQVVTEFDVYDLLRNGDKSHDAQLLPGDVIYIPPVGPQVAIYGSVDEPGIYELKGETTIAAALKYTGGLTNLAEADRVLLERIQNHRRRRVDEFPLDPAGSRRTLEDGDMLQVFPISPRFENAVTLRGNVALPGRIPWHEGMRVSDLIPSRDSLITRRYWNQQNHLVAPLTAVGSQNLPTGNQNQPGAQGAGQYQQGMPGTGLYQQGMPGTGLYQQGAQGPGQYLQGMPGTGPTSRGLWSAESYAGPRPPLDVMTDLFQYSAEINWEYAAIERLDQHDLSTHVIPFNLGRALDDPASSDNQVLQPGDVVVIFSRSDLPLPEDKHAAFVRVTGEVNAPGVYRINPGQTLRELVERAGGLTPHSYLYASQLTRASTRAAQELELRQAAEQMQRDLAARYAAQPTTGASGATNEQTQLSTQQALLTQLATVHPTGRVVLDMKPNAQTVQDIPEFPLEDGDQFYIPFKLNTVQVAGAVYNENAFRYQPRKRLGAYLNDAGGPTRQADAKRIFLIRADGTVVSRQRHDEIWQTDFAKTVMLPGDAIIVPNKVKGPNVFAQQWPAFTQILSQVGTMGAVLGTAY